MMAERLMESLDHATSVIVMMSIFLFFYIFGYSYKILRQKATSCQKEFIL